MSQQLYKNLCNRFPDHSDLIHRLARVNSNFVEIVQDYADVLEMLKKLRILKDPLAQNLTKEYRMLQKELESEIEQFFLNSV